MLRLLRNIFSQTGLKSDRLCHNQHGVPELLPQTLGIDRNTVIILDAMRKQRNVADYSGDFIPESTVTTCIAQAEELVKHFRTWLTIK
jgi:hypothetical protein